jgi:hypothetical protein
LGRFRSRQTSRQFRVVHPAGVRESSVSWFPGSDGFSEARNLRASLIPINGGSPGWARSANFYQSNTPTGTGAGSPTGPVATLLIEN